MSTRFADRLAYLRWLWLRGRLSATERQFSTWLGVGDKWYYKWKASAEAPEGRTEFASIGRAVGEDVALWLYDAKGDPPEAELWKDWTRASARVPKVAESAPIAGGFTKVSSKQLEAAAKKKRKGA